MNVETGYLTCHPPTEMSHFALLDSPMTKHQWRAFYKDSKQTVPFRSRTGFSGAIITAAKMCLNFRPAAQALSL